MQSSETDTILALNSGSSSLKFGIYRQAAGEECLVLAGSAEGIGRLDGSLHIRRADGTPVTSKEPVLESQTEALRAVADELRRHGHDLPTAIGHRIVHGGPHLREHQPLTEGVCRQLEAAVHFAPLHIPIALKLIRDAQRLFPDARHFACFDTAFHRTMPEVAAHLPLPRRYFEQGVIRYGFHGLSYESIVFRLGQNMPERAVLAHLGNGSSITAVHRGVSIDTSMGLTPTGGIPMGTRSGDLDPGIVLYLMRTERIGADGLELLLNHKSGLAGLSDGHSDMRELVSRSAAGDSSARLAVDIYTVAIRKAIGSYAALMGGLDLVAFTGGIGENSEAIRKQICEGLEFLGMESAKIKIFQSEEELQIARHCRRLLKSSQTRT